MRLEQELLDYKTSFEASAPPGTAAFLNSKIEEMTATFPFDGVPKVGDLAPDFSLPGVTGAPLSLAGALAGGPVILTFYRGAWCPYCNIQLAAYERALPQITAAGGHLIAISPQRPDGSLSMTEKNGLTFDVLSDIGNAVARAFGLVDALPAELQAAYTSFGVDLATINGDTSWELPIPATFVIARNRTIMLVHSEVDYRIRLSPDAIVDALHAAETA